MAARAGGPPGGAQVISTFNGGNVVSTQVPSLNFDGQNAGDLIKTVTGIQPNMVNGVTLDNTFVSHQQYRYLPYPVNNRTITWQFTTPNWCHVRDIAINLQCIFRLLGKSPTQYVTAQINETQNKMYAGGYHITNGGLLSMFQNMRIKMGAQVDILTAFEKTKSAFHICNTWLRGMWDQRTVFALIDRWDAWYPCGLATHFKCSINGDATITAASATINSLYMRFFNTVDAMYQSKQSDCHFERLLSRVLADKGLVSTATGVSSGIGSDFRFIESIENVSFPFPFLHSLFQQNIMLPPGMQFIIEIDVPMYSDYVMPAAAGNAPDPNPINALWANIGYVTDYSGMASVGANQLDDTTFQKYAYYTLGSFIGVSVNQTSVFNSITMNTVNLKPEIARSLQDERIKRPLVYNFSQMVATTVGSYFPGQTVYNFTLPPNQAIPTQFLFAWVNPTTYSGPDNTGLFPGQPNSGTPTFNNAYANGVQNFAYGPPPTQSYFDGPAPMDSDSFDAVSPLRKFLGSSLTPLPVPLKRMIVRRGGFQEIFQYGTYYDGLGNNVGAFCQSATTANNFQWIANSVKLLGAKNLTPDATQKYFDHLEEYQWDRKSLNGLGPIERRMKYSYTPLLFTEGKWSCIQMNPCKNDTGQYSSDQNAYSVDVQIEMDLDWLNSVNWTGLNANSKLICVRVLPAQLSAAIDGTVRIYTWPNLLISPNAVVSGNPPPAGPGGSI